MAHATDRIVKRSQGEVQGYEYLRTPKKNPGPKHDWTPERVQWLTEWHGKGLSMSQMSAEFGRAGVSFSRNAIIGKIHRLGLAPNVRKKKPSTVRVKLEGKRPRKEKRGSDTTTGTIGMFKTFKPAHAPGPMEIDIVSISAPKCEPVLMSQANDKQCHWPASNDIHDMTVCGAPVTCGSYCGFHARKAFSRAPTVGRNAKYRKVQETDLVA
jgi:GcrA cell cycle regulator